MSVLKSFIILMAGFTVSCLHKPESYEINAADQQPAVAVPPNSDGIINAFEAIHGQLDLPAIDGDPELIPWGTAYLLSAYLTIYKATKDTRYLELFVERAEKVLAFRADYNGEADYRGKVRPVWITTGYSQGKPAAFLVHSGMITYPMADFAHTVTTNTSLHQIKLKSGKTLFDRAQFFGEQVMLTIEAHDGEWSDKEGAYVYPADFPVAEKGKVLPINMYASLGRSLVLMHELTKNPTYKARAVALSTTFKKHLKLNKKKNAYEWLYAPGVRKTMEDASHAAIDMEFAILSFEHGLGVFTKSDMERFANTFLKQIFLGQNRFAKYVDGKEPNSDAALSTGRLMPLASFNTRIAEIGRTYYQHQIDAPTAHDKAGDNFITLLGLANLKLYSK